MDTALVASPSLLEQGLEFQPVLSPLKTSISPRKRPLLISLSVIEVCRECSTPQWSWPNKSLHFASLQMCLSSSFTIQWTPQRGSPPLLSHRFLQSWGHVEVWIGGHICALSLCFSISLSLSVLLVLPVDESLAVSCALLVLMLTEFLLSENVRISIIPHLHF